MGTFHQLMWPIFADLDDDKSVISRYTPEGASRNSVIEVLTSESFQGLFVANAS